MLKDRIDRMFDNITNEGTASEKEITANIYRHYGNFKGSIMVSVFGVIGVLSMAIIGLYGAAKAIIRK